MNFIINPGTGPTTGTAEQAQANMAAFVEALGLPCEYKLTGQCDNGRFSFVLTHGGRTAEVDMPGEPLDIVQGTRDGLSIFDQPRLYVDGSSWLWGFALEIAHDHLSGEGDQS